MCDATKTSREHAPPECLFPEKKDIGQDMRRNLITVPSCDIHNSKKSEDDEFLRAIILFSAVKYNKVAEHQFLGKFLRGVARSSKKYSDYVDDKGTISNGEYHMLKVDRARFDNCIEHIARAIFFYEYKMKWELPIHAASPNFYSGKSNDAATQHNLCIEAIEVTRKYLYEQPIQGENPKVFKYRTKYDEAACSYAFAGIFYDFFEIYTFSSKDKIA